MDELLEGSLLRIPAQFADGLRRVAEELLDLGRAEVARVDGDERLARLAIDAFLVGTHAPPLQLDAGAAEGVRAEFPHRVHLTRGDDEVIGLVVLQDEPHALDEVRGVAPIALGRQVAEEEAILPAMDDVRDGQRDLARDERFRLQPFIIGHPEITRRQELPRAYSLNGALYLAKIDWLLKQKSFIGKETLGFVMSLEKSGAAGLALIKNWVDSL